jgi:hypothetical protein
MTDTPEPNDQDRIERGEDPDVVVGTDPKRPQWRDPDAGWTPDPHQADEWRKIAAEIGRERRPRREDVYPYLLIRAVVGDRAARPTWPPTPCWESPDILLIDASYGGPFDPVRLVTSPMAGRSYRVFVRVWNLGLLPAVGVHVKAWAVNPGFFGAFNQNDPYYQQHLIGGRWVELADRTRPGCTAVVELDRTWDIDPAESGHHCLLAEVSCPLDQAGGPLLANDDRHVGQRNLTILTGSAGPMPLIGTLGGQVPDGFTLELTHAGPAAVGVLQALTGGQFDGREEVNVAELGEVRAGVLTKTNRHLLAAFTHEGRSVVVPSERLAEAGGARIFERPGGVRRFLDEVGPGGWERVGITTEAPLAEALGETLARHFDLPRDASAGELADRLGGRAGALHPLRFTLTGREADLAGGYTVVVG